MKKILVCMISTLIILSSCININAAQIPKLEKTSIKKDSRSSTIIDQTEFTSIHPGEKSGTGLSASIIEYTLSAQRETNGSVTVLINETFHSVRGYYEHLATDLSGDNFIPSKNTAYYTPCEGIYSINLPVDTVSADGYIYLKISVAPEGVGQLFTTINYKIPVDYDKYSTSDDSHYTLEAGEEFTGVFSAQITRFNAKAMIQFDNSILVIINFKSNNPYLWFKHSATSKDGDIYIPQKDSWYRPPDSKNDAVYIFVLPENSVSTNGYVYLSAQFDLPFGMYNAGAFKLPILNE